MHRLEQDLQWRPGDPASRLERHEMEAAASIEPAEEARRAGADPAVGVIDRRSVAFEFSKVGSNIDVVPVWTADCRPYTLTAERPIISSITKSGGYSADQPNADFYASFLADPLVDLPQGRWVITAIASFVERRDCSDASHLIRVAINVTVLP
jgi:hypothetical protein